MTTRHTLALVASFDHQVTGVTVAEDGRIFVNFPRWTEDAPTSVAELLPNGGLRPYPNAEWNRWRNAKKNEIDPKDHWVCVQSVFADWKGYLWVLDPAAPATGFIVPDGPKLVKIDLAADRVVQSFAFGEDLAPMGSYLNDIRISPDGRYAYITDSGPKSAIVVVDLKEGSAWRVLEEHPKTQPEPDVVVTVDGKPLRRPDGRGAEFSSDGIALSRDGEWLYWQALTGRTLHRVPTAALHDSTSNDEALAECIEIVGENGVADGLWIDARGRLWISALEENAVKIRDLETGRVSIAVRDERLRWPDTFAEGPDGTIYVTASHIQDMSWYAPQNPARLATELFRITE